MSRSERPRDIFCAPKGGEKIDLQMLESYGILALFNDRIVTEEERYRNGK